ncbi:MAG: carboxymuconolactone decarboxylase family protein [Candidatus Binatia bacterium]
MLPAAMAYIRHIAPSQAGGRLAQVYREVRSEVPRVPNLMQVFSLRPETMEGVYRHWIALMWSPRVPRQVKEMLAVCVSVAARCDYCADAHMIYLLASGMDGDKARDVTARLVDADGMTDAEREAVRMALRLTTDPRSMKDIHRTELAAAWPVLEQRIEIVAVIAAFNSVTRMANALGVDSEIPAPLRRFEAGKRGAIGLLARLASFSMNMDEKTLPGLPPEVDRAAMRELFLHQIGFASLPPGFDLLEACPEIFDVQLRALRTSAAVMPRDRWIRVGLVVSRLTGCEYFSTNCGDWLRQRGENPADVIAAAEGSPTSLPDVEHCCVRFARDMTLHSHTITEDRIHELRRCGLSDGAILDLAFVTAVFNGLVRLVLGLAPN